MTEFCPPLLQSEVLKLIGGKTTPKYTKKLMKGKMGSRTMKIGFRQLR